MKSTSLLIPFVLVSASPQMGCGTQVTPVVPVVVSAVLDCTQQSSAAIESAVLQLTPLLTGLAVDWTSFYGKALSFGKEIGACAIATLATDFLGNTKNPASTDGRKGMTQTLDLYRKQEIGGKTIHIAKGDV